MKTSWSNAEFIILKLCIACAYILIGAYFHKFFRDHYLVVLGAFAVTMVWSVYLWAGKMRRTRQE